jgi:hypothetical protein
MSFSPFGEAALLGFARSGGLRCWRPEIIVLQFEYLAGGIEWSGHPGQLHWLDSWEIHLTV